MRIIGCIFWVRELKIEVNISSLFSSYPINNFKCKSRIQNNYESSEIKFAKIIKFLLLLGRVSPSTIFL